MVTPRTPEEIAARLADEERELEENAIGGERPEPKPIRTYTPEERAANLADEERELEETANDD